MALVKSFETSFGVNAEYWVLSGIPTIDRYNTRFVVQLNGYLNEDARWNGAAPLMTKQIFWEDPNSYPVPDNGYLNQAEIYGKILQREEWSGAVAVSTPHWE